MAINIGNNIMIVNIHIEPLQILWLQDSSSTSHELQYRA